MILNILKRLGCLAREKSRNNYFISTGIKIVDEKLAFIKIYLNVKIYMK